MTNVYLIHVTTFSSDIYSESYVETDVVFGSEQDAETYILENNLLEKGDVSVIKSQLKGNLCLNLK